MEIDELDYLLPANCPNTYFDTWDRHNSIAFSKTAKGLHNAPGENNCFVNSAVQVFWHLDVFRRSYRRLSGHTCMGNSCIFCALKVIFTQFQFSDQSSLHPDALRKALAETFANQQRFQLGHMDDAAECFENILRRIHFHIANDCSEDTCSAPHCLPHQKFSLRILEKVVCPCGASSNPLRFSEMVHYISAKALVSQARVMQETGDTLHPDRFGLLLRNANAMGDIRDCPGSCGKTVQIRRTLLNSPDVVSIGLVWDSDHPTVEMTTEVARNIGTAIFMQDVFHSVMQDLHALPKLQLVGLVCYYGKHYSTFVFHSKLQVWIYFDDAQVREIGPQWENVVDKCSKGRYQPLLLLYANPNASPVSVDTAPKKRVMAPGYSLPGGNDDDSILDRSHESISSQQSYNRSRTPNPEPSRQLPESSVHPRARSVTPSANDLPREDFQKQIDHSRQQSYLQAMTTKLDKAKHPLKLGGQASGGSGIPGPMIPTSFDEVDGPPHTASQSFRENENYTDYTLSTSGQYRRPSMDGFEPVKLPLTPNMKGYAESQRKDSFKKSKDPVRVDVVRYMADSSRPQDNLVAEHPHQDQAQRLNQAPNLPSKAGNVPMYSHGREHPHFRQRSLSQGGDEAYASDTSCSDGPQQHTVIQPMVSSQKFDYIDGMSHIHTPVQSGLATLPRKKKELSKDLSGDQRPSSSLAQEGTNAGRPGSIGSVISAQDQQAMSNVTNKKVAESDKKFKKLKKEQKKMEKKRAKDLSKSQPDLSITAKPPPHPASVPSAGNTDKLRHPEEFRDDKVVYIHRRMVEDILKSQGLQRQPSTHSTNSSSSIDSDSIMGRLLASKYSDGSIHTDASFDNVSLGSHKDSGYGSSDRNSSSSTGSGTIDPYTQYFISKSMVVPRNLNPQFLQHPAHQMVSDFTAPHPQVYSMNQPEGQAKELSGMSREEMTRHVYETLTQRKVMHPIKESSQEDILKLLPNDQMGSGPPARDSSPSTDGLGKEGRPPPIPPKNFAAFQVSKSAHHREPSIDSLDKDEVKNEYFVSMCEKADGLMDNCILAETEGDLPAAMRYCDSALGCLKEAMNQTDISNKALVYAQKKHNSCLLKSRSLFKRSTASGPGEGGLQGGKRSSITSTDSDSSDKPVRRVTSKERLLAAGRGSSKPGQQPPPAQIRHQQQDSTGSSSRKSPHPMSQPPVTAPGHGPGSQVKSDQPRPLSSVSQATPASSSTISSCPPGREDPQSQRIKSHVSRASAAEKPDSDSVHSRSGSNSSIRSSASLPSSMSQISGHTNSKAHTSSGLLSTTPSTPNAPVPLDAYGTLPRNRKARRTSDPTGNSEVYQMYLNRQKNLQTSSGSDTRESDSSSCDGNVQRKMNKAELKDLKNSSVVQRQIQQFGHPSQSQNINNSQGDQRPGPVDTRPQLGQWHSYDGMSQRGISAGDSSLTATQAYVPDRSSHQSQGGSSVSTQNLPQQQQLLSANYPPHGHSTYVAMAPSVQTTGASNSSSVQLLRQPQPQEAQTAKPTSQINPSMLNYPQTQNHPQSQYVYEQQLDHSVRYQNPVQSGQGQLVSGYSQPLPGMSALSQSNPRTSNQTVLPAPTDQAYSPAHTNLSAEASQPHAINPDKYRNLSQVDSSRRNNPGIPSQSSHTTQRTVQPTSVQNVSQGVQNLTVGRRNSGGPPPPPPARTTSNPNFKLQQPPPQQYPMHQQQQQHNNNHYQQQQGQRPEVGQQRRVASVPPNSHLHPSGAQTSSKFTPAHSGPSSSQRHSSAANGKSSNMANIPGTQMKHAISSTALNYMPIAPRPLERYASQPDCQNLVDPSSYPNTDFPPPPLAPSPAMTSVTNSRPDVRSGSNKNLQRTSNNFVPCVQDTFNPQASQNPQRGDEQFVLPQQTVKALASKFDQSTDKPEIRPKPSVATRTRSKSESGSKKPKSVLKSKKNKSNKTARKSVTFAENISNYAAGYESAAELTSFSSSARMCDRAYFSDDEDNFPTKAAVVSDNEIDDVEDASSTSDDMVVREELACQLCRKREIEVGKGYCSKCSFYMGRLVQS